MRTLFSFLSLSLLLALSAAAADVPNLVGTWETSAHEGVARGSGIHGSGPADEARFVSMTFTMVIEKQEGHKFTGVKTGKGGSEKLVGVIGYDNQSIYIIEDEGMFEGKLLSPTKMELVYLHDTAKAKIVGVGLYEKKK